MLESLPPLPERPALFFDVDGTLLALAADPDAVHADVELVHQLAQLRTKLAGALALLSGRRLETLDRLFAPLQLPAAGLHGLQRRDATGRMRSVAQAGETLDEARQVLTNLVAALPGLYFEDKGATLAVHFRPLPGLEPRVLRCMNALARRIGPTFHVQPGHCLYELKSRLENKGTALIAFMHEPPFAGRIPVVIGDDLTDIDAFKVAEAMGGIAVAVGDRVHAPWRMSGDRALREWVATLAGP